MPPGPSSQLYAAAAESPFVYDAPSAGDVRVITGGVVSATTV